MSRWSAVLQGEGAQNWILVIIACKYSTGATKRTRWLAPLSFGAKTRMIETKTVGTLTGLWGRKTTRGYTV